MKLATFRHEETTRAGVVDTDASLVHPLPEDVTVDALVAGGLAAALEAGRGALAAPGIPLTDVTLLPPLRPASIRDFVAFSEHVLGVRRSIDDAEGLPEVWRDAPTFYFTNPHAIVGPDADVRRPGACRALDFELEVAAVVAAEGSSLTEAEAQEAIFGYLIFNDFSARDIQSREMKNGLGPAKGKDFCTAIGPWLTTADEVADRLDEEGFLDLWCTVAVNGETIGEDVLSNMGWTFASMVAYASRDSIVRAGDVLASGTTGNGGCLAELWGVRGEQSPPPLEPGDVVTLSVERLGTLSNTVVDGEPAPPLTPVRLRDPEAGRAAYRHRHGRDPHSGS
ncbi:fumarylacetoacetate hydrolase family protein [Actinomycetota bacterium]